MEKSYTHVCCTIYEKYLEKTKFHMLILILSLCILMNGMLTKEIRGIFIAILKIHYYYLIY